MSDDSALAQEALNLLQDAVLLVRDDGSVCFANQAASALTPGTGSVISQPISNLLGDSLRWSALQERLRETVAWTSRRTVPGMGPVLLTARRRSGGGAVIRLRVLTAVEQRSMGERDLLAKAMASAGVGLWTHEFDTGEVWHSPHCFAITGLDPDTLLSSASIVPLLDDDARELLSQAVSRHLTEGAPYAPIFSLTRPDGEPRVVQLFGQLGRGPDSAPQRWWGGLVDLTEATRERSQLEALRDQLLHAQRMDSLGVLAGGVAHDFNNLLTVIVGWLELVSLESELSASTREDIDQIFQAVARATELASQLLVYSRKQTTLRRPCDLRDVVGEATRFLRRPLPKHIALTLELPDAAVPVRIDGGQLHQVITNLVNNATHAIGDAGTIAVRVQVDGGLALLHVADTGCGMDDETRLRIFDPFFTTRGKGKGTGLGLATSQSIVQQHGGEITVRSVVGEGTTMTISLPLFERGAQGAVPSEALPEERGGDETVLLVEDQLMVRQIAARQLRGAGYTVVEAAGGQDAIRLLSQGHVDLLLTDVLMPQTNGPQLHAVALQHHPTLPVLYVSGYPADALSSQGLDPEQVCYLRKPFGRAQLLRAVREALKA